MTAIIGTSDQPCWLAEACKILLLLLESPKSTVARRLLVMHHGIHSYNILAPSFLFAACSYLCVQDIIK